MTVQIFISYARVDDEVPGEDPKRRGFVTALHEELICSFRSYGEPKPKIWRDVKKMDGADQFNDRIAEAISESALFVAVLSPNWMSSEYCKKELKAFSERWRDDTKVRERIIVVAKRDVPKDRRPSLLQDQVGIRFYAFDDREETELAREFYFRGVARDERFFDQAEELSKVLWRRAKRLGAGDDGRAIELPEATPTRGKVFLAKPAPDMRNSYRRLVQELTSGGFAVVPDPLKEVPTDASAIKFIDDALADVDVSIHLLGDKPGFTPDDADPIVELQLKRARLRPENSERPGFRRLIWAPTFIDTDRQEGTNVEPRNSSEVLDKFDEYMEGDSIEGDTLSKFVELVAQRLARKVAPPEVGGGPKAGSKVYIWHRDDDIDYALAVGRALKERQIWPEFPAYEGSDAEKVQYHRQHLRDCDSVLVCWANAPDVWAKITAKGLVDWKVLGRSKGFERRALVAGPPPGVPKKAFVEMCPPDEIDVALDLTAKPEPRPEDFNRLLAAK